MGIQDLGRIILWLEQTHSEKYKPVEAAVQLFLEKICAGDPDNFDKVKAVELLLDMADESEGNLEESANLIKTITKNRFKNPECQSIMNIIIAQELNKKPRIYQTVSFPSTETTSYVMNG